jgi:tRNA threonylcarbamoyladenosine biosynthesis protein TsaE
LDRELTKCSFNLKTEEETKRLGRLLAKLLPEGAVLLLKGDLGCGKTVLTKGIASGLGIPEEEVSSPSFTVIHEYPRLVHGDLYRVGEELELELLGLDEILEDDRVKVFEWGEPLLRVIRPTLIVECKEVQGVRQFTIHDFTGKICQQLTRLWEEKGCQE